MILLEKKVPVKESAVEWGEFVSFLTANATKLDYAEFQNGPMASCLQAALYNQAVVRVMGTRVQIKVGSNVKIDLFQRDYKSFTVSVQGRMILIRASMVDKRNFVQFVGE